MTKLHNFETETATFCGIFCFSNMTHAATYPKNTVAFSTVTIIRDQWTFDDGFIHKTSFVVDDKCQKPFSNTAKTSIILPPLREPAMEILSANGIAE